MNLNDDAWLLLGILTTIAIPLLTWLVWHNVTKVLYPGESLLVLRFGKLAQRLDNPGLHFIWDKIAPWTQLMRVSRRLDYELLDDLEIHDAAGTSVKVDVFVEYRVVDAMKASFNVENLPQALANAASHSVIAYLGGQHLKDIVCDSGQLSDQVREELAKEADAWGIVMEKIMLCNVRPSGLAMEELLTEIAARLEKAKARVEEEGRQDVALIEARTTELIAERSAVAKGCFLTEIGKAYEELRKHPDVYKAYQQLHELVLLRPAHTVAFRGFSTDSLRPTEAMFFEPPATGSPSTN
jgi:regulator of protease activity HflC (stomatin/prohibitin superfamily)